MPQDRLKIGSFAPSEGCLYERRSFVFWFNFDGLYRVESDSLSNLEQVVFLQNDNKIKNVAVTSYHVAALLPTGKIIIKCILNNRTVGILQAAGDPDTRVFSIISSNYYFR